MLRERFQVATPKQFEGEGRCWSAEHLFLSSISSCFMSTYPGFLRKSGVEISRFECNAIGQVEIVEGRYKFTRINLYPKSYIADEMCRKKATFAIEKTYKYCLISNSINALLFCHSKIVIDRSSIQLTKDESCVTVPKPGKNNMNAIQEIF